MNFVTFHAQQDVADAAHPDANILALQQAAYVQMIDMMFESAAWFHPERVATVLTSAATDLSALKTPVERVDHPVRADSLMLDRALAQWRYLEHCAFDRPIVLLDSDILLLAPIADVFSEDFDVALTWRIRDEMPINNGVMFLNHRRPEVVRRFFRRYVEIYQARDGQDAGWYGDQRAMQDAVGLALDAYEGREWVDVDGCRVRLLPCDTWNRMPEKSLVEMLWPRGKLLHFKGRRKRLMREYRRMYFEGRSKWKVLPSVVRGRLARFGRKLAAKPPSGMSHFDAAP